MSATPFKSVGAAAGIALAAIGAFALESIPEHRAKQIFEAAPVKPQVKPVKARRVLIWNTPAHLMEKDPHKGY